MKPRQEDRLSETIRMLAKLDNKRMVEASTELDIDLFTFYMSLDPDDPLRQSLEDPSDDFLAMERHPDFGIDFGCVDDSALAGLQEWQVYFVAAWFFYAASRSPRRSSGKGKDSSSTIYARAARRMLEHALRHEQFQRRLKGP